VVAPPAAMENPGDKEEEDQGQLHHHPYNWKVVQSTHQREDVAPRQLWREEPLSIDKGRGAASNYGLGSCWPGGKREKVNKWGRQIKRTLPAAKR